MKHTKLSFACKSQFCETQKFLKQGTFFLWNSNSFRMKFWRILYKRNLSVNPTQNYRWQHRKEYKGKTNWAQSALARLLWLLYKPSSTHRPNTYVPHAWLGVGNWAGRLVRQGSTGLPPPDSTPTPPICCTGPEAPTDHPPFVSISHLLRHSPLRQSYFEITTT